MTLGFTGTSHGMTQRQRATVRYLFSELNLSELHHGDCVGADAEAHKLALDTGAKIVVHPPTDIKKRAFCLHASAVSNKLSLEVEQPYLKRNWDIVHAGVDGLIAAPKDSVQPKSLRGQGTWTTIGYARQAGRRIWIVWPDGTFKAEA